MKLKLDENLPRSARDRLAVLGFDADTVVDESLGGRDDDTVWLASQAEGRLLITQDLDAQVAILSSPDAPESALSPPADATEQQLDTWAERVLTAGTIDEVFSLGDGCQPWPRVEADCICRDGVEAVRSVCVKVVRQLHDQATLESMLKRCWRWIH